MTFKLTTLRLLFFEIQRQNFRNLLWNKMIDSGKCCKFFFLLRDPKVIAWLSKIWGIMRCKWSIYIFSLLHFKIANLYRTIILVIYFCCCSCYHPRMRVGNNFSVCLSVCLYVSAKTFELMKLGTSFSVHNCIYTISRSSSSTKVKVKWITFHNWHNLTTYYSSTKTCSTVKVNWRSR